MNIINPPRLFDLSRESGQSLRHFSDVLSSGELFRYPDNGAQSKSGLLEEQFAAYFGKESAVAVANGTTAIRLALLAAGVGPGEQVLLSAYSFIACAMALLSVGAIPVPMDMGSALDLSVPRTSRELGSLKAALVVHVQGHAVPLADLRAFCDDRGIPLIEDACQGIGASSRSGRAGAVGDIAVTSFQQAKQISAGEGGLLAGPRDLIERAYRLADLGAVREEGIPDWDSEDAVVGENLRMTELQAALALDQLNALEQALREQRSVRDRLWAGIGPWAMPLHSEVPAADSGAHTLLRARSGRAALDFRAALADDGIASRIVWPKTYLEYGLMNRNSLVQVGLAAGQWPARSARLAPRIISVTLSRYTTQEVITMTAESIARNARLLENPEQC
jgi:dTDP-4-amino-4,6-dideoxygalactose transaminase